jgi:hypothetical protein
MIKTTSCGLAATGALALVLGFGATEASAFSASAALTRAVGTDIVQAQTPEQIARAKRRAERRRGGSAGRRRT